MGRRTEFSNFFIFGDQSWPVESLLRSLPEPFRVAAWIDGKGWTGADQLVSPNVGVTQSVRSRQLPMSRALNAAESAVLPAGASEESVAIIGFSDPDISQSVANRLREKHSDIRILEIGSRMTRSALTRRKRSVAWSDLLSDGMENEIRLLQVQGQIRKLRDSLKDAKTVAVLLQDDPDPDGLASALALRKILGRNAQSAPIVSFGRITRPENMAMAKLLEIEVRTVTTEELNTFDKRLLVDCQPSFFKNRVVQADVIVDHHPKSQLPPSVTPPLLEDIHEDVGALSSLMVQYLRAADIELSERLATALLYGIKTDTLILNRQVSDVDLESFIYLYPRINGGILRRIERPELPLSYLKAFRAGLGDLYSQNGLVILPLGRVDRDEWVPQGADFALQVEGAEKAIACGVWGNQIVISGRVCSSKVHCGDLFKKVFLPLGVAGGHRTMAKAMIDRKRWVAKFGPGSLTRSVMAQVISEQVELALSAD